MYIFGVIICDEGNVFWDHLGHHDVFFPIYPLLFGDLLSDHSCFISIATITYATTTEKPLAYCGGLRTRYQLVVAAMHVGKPMGKRGQLHGLVGKKTFPKAAQVAFIS
jgi:hypothetical protein